MNTTEARQWYNAYKGEKCSFPAFYNRLKRGYSYEDAIKNIYYNTSRKNKELREFWNNYDGKKVGYGRFIEVYKQCGNKEKAIKREGFTIYERFPKEYEIYQSYQRPKASFSLFIERLKKGKNIEQALIPTSGARPGGNIIYDNHAEAKKKLHKNDNYYIEITYPVDEAQVFRNVYIDMINKLELERLDASPHRAMEIEKELKKLHSQLDVFNIYNPV